VRFRQGLDHTSIKFGIAYTYTLPFVLSQWSCKVKT
jgi:uncharacterized membrane protein